MIGGYCKENTNWTEYKIQEEDTIVLRRSEDLSSDLLVLVYLDKQEYKKRSDQTKI